MYRKRPPDWDFWKQKTYVQLWEAAFLSCNIEPDSLRDSRCGERDFKFISVEARQAFADTDRQATSKTIF